MVYRLRPALTSLRHGVRVKHRPDTIALPGHLSSPIYVKERIFKLHARLEGHRYNPGVARVGVI